MTDTLIFWKARADLNMSPEDIARELNWGEEVEGLIDLPVKEILDRLKVEFPMHEERPGLLVAQKPAEGRWEASWTWQHLKIELHDVPDDARQRISDALAGFGCRVFEA